MASKDGEHKEIAIAEVVRDFADITNRVAYGNESVIVTRRGKPLVLIVPVAKGRKNAA